MNIIEKLISGYPSGDVAPQDFIDHLSIGADGWVGAWIAIGLAVIFGLLVYIIPIYLTEKEKVGPYPLWMHTFYFAADFMGIDVQVRLPAGDHGPRVSPRNQLAVHEQARDHPVVVRERVDIGDEEVAEFRPHERALLADEQL